jgi:hypothetical protein
MHEESEKVQIRYFCRDLTLRGKVRQPLEAAKRLVLPDCDYYLYAVLDMKVYEGEEEIGRDLS